MTWYEWVGIVLIVSVYVIAFALLLLGINHDRKP
jgi:hypothetical protein